jgi:epoxyqueuosine reductase
LAGSIPVEFRRAIGNRIYGCDDCQLVCPWNKFARPTPRRISPCGTDSIMRQLIELFAWSEANFSKNRRQRDPAHRLSSDGCAISPSRSAMRRPRPRCIEALRARAQHPSSWCASTCSWALAQHSSIPVDDAHP